MEDIMHQYVLELLLSRSVEGLASWLLPSKYSLRIHCVFIAYSLHIGFQTPTCTPSQQTQEAWHRSLATSIIPGMAHCSTEHLFSRLLPQLITMDALRIPSKLTFHVEGPCYPKAMAETALDYIDAQDTHVRQEGDQFIFLHLHNNLGARTIDKRMIEMFWAAWKGVKDKRIKDLDHLLDLCRSFCVLQPACDKYGHVHSDANKLKLTCLCDEGMNYGFCPHILAANHICKEYNVRYHLLKIGHRTLPGKNGNYKPAKALRKAPSKHIPTSDDVHRGTLGR